jgi:toxin ParE1/3/4
VNRPVIVRPIAEADIRGIHQYLHATGPTPSERFRQRLAELFANIESLPELYAVVWKNVRAARVRRFRYVVYYVISDQAVEILGVIHAARNPAVWRKRL